MDVQHLICADIADTLVATNELSEPLIDFRYDEAGQVLVDVYEPEFDGDEDLPVHGTFGVQVVLTEPGSEPPAAAPAHADHDQLLTAYSAALDEIFALRTAAAYEATLLERLLALKTFPAGRRQVTGRQRERLVASAQGKVAAAYAPIRDVALRAARDNAGVSHLLTRHQFEESLRTR